MSSSPSVPTRRLRPRPLSVCSVTSRRRPDCSSCCHASEETAWRSLRNVGNIQLVASDQLSAYDAVISDRIVFSQAGLDAFVNRGSVAAESVEEQV